MSIPSIPGFFVYAFPEPGSRYCIGDDPAQGNPTSDFSSAVVMNVDTGEEAAVISGRFEIVTFASHVDAVGMWYNRAPVMVELNNHGHATLLWLKEFSKLECLKGHGAQAGPGWHTTGKGKALLLDQCGESLRDLEVTIHHPETASQLQNLEGSTNQAPQGQHDDLAMAFCLANAARVLLTRRQVNVHDLMDEIAKGFEKPAAVASDALPQSEKGGVQFVATFDEFYVYLTSGPSGKVWLWSSTKREEAIWAAHCAGLPDCQQNLEGKITVERLEQIRQEVLGKMKCG